MKLPLLPNTKDKARKDQIDLQKLLGRFYEKEEKVLWVEDSKYSLMPVHIAIGISLAFGFFIFFIVFLFQERYNVNPWIPFAVVSIFIFCVLYLPNFFSASKQGDCIITTDHLITNGEKLEHRKISSVYEFERIINHLIFYDKFIPKGERIITEKREIIRFAEIENLQDPIKIFESIWNEKGPYGKLEIAIDKLMEQKGFQAINDINKVRVARYTREINGLDYNISIQGLLPIDSIRVSVRCPNNHNNFLLLFGQDATKQQVSDVEISDQLFDNSFIIQSDSRAFLENVLTERTKELMLLTLGASKCRYEYGDTRGPVTKEKAIDNSSNFSDQEDILDFQLLDEKTTYKKPATITTSEGTTSTLILNCMPESSIQFNPAYLVRFLGNCLDSTVELGQHIQQYNG